MTQQANVHWSIEEKKIAESAIKTAYDHEVKDLINEIRNTASLISHPEDMWKLHDYLSAKRHDIDGKYDERESFLIYTLSRLVKEELLDLTELEGLDEEKRAKINVLTRI